MTVSAGIWFWWAHRVGYYVDPVRANRLNLTPGEYANGPRRAAAAAERVSPRLTDTLTPLGLSIGRPVLLRAFKEEAELELWMQPSGEPAFKLIRTWPIAALSGKPGPKQREGDRQVPEGFYAITPERMKPDSRYHLAMNIGYPNATDRALGRTGSFIMIHGDQRSIGCLAMTDPVIEEIYTFCDAAHREGQEEIPVHIFPFRMAEARLAQAETEHPQWMEFWRELQRGYASFERSRRIR